MKISICIRVKYPVDHLLAMLLCLRRQTHEDWEAIVTTDGPNQDARTVVTQMNDSRLVFFETAVPLGCWGHPYRTASIQKCTGDLIGLTNDDNYYVPDYFKQMVRTLVEKNAKMVMCNMLHKDFEYNIIDTQPKFSHCDLGNWLVYADIAKSTPWPGNTAQCDGIYVETIARKAKRVAILKKPFLVKN